MAETIEELEAKIAALPRGTIVTKNIDGKPYFYQQYKENKKTVSNFLSNEDAEKMRPLIEERRELQKRLKEIKKNTVPASQPKNTSEYIMNAITGNNLIEMAETARNYKKRDCYEKISSYLYGKPADKVCLVYGLRRTGKTTLLKQLVLDMSEENRKQTVYIKARVGETIADLNKDIKTARENGIKFFLIDEITLLEDFIDSAALLSDVYAVQGLKFVLSGTDSLGFYFAESEELYDRTVTVHTTFISYKEHARLLGITSIDEYIRYGGTLRAGELDFDDEDVKHIEELYNRGIKNNAIGLKILNKEEVLKIAVEGAKLLQQLTEEDGGNYRFEYSPESFTGTELDYALEICEWRNYKGHDFVSNFSCCSHSQRAFGTKTDWKENEYSSGSDFGGCVCRSASVWNIRCIFRTVDRFAACCNECYYGK